MPAHARSACPLGTGFDAGCGSNRRAIRINETERAGGRICESQEPDLPAGRNELTLPIAWTACSARACRGTGGATRNDGVPDGDRQKVELEIRRLLRPERCCVTATGFDHFLRPDYVIAVDAA